MGQLRCPSMLHRLKQKYGRRMKLLKMQPKPLSFKALPSGSEQNWLFLISPRKKVQKVIERLKPRKKSFHLNNFCLSTTSLICDKISAFQPMSIPLFIRSNHALLLTCWLLLYISFLVKFRPRTTDLIFLTYCKIIIYTLT